MKDYVLVLTNSTDENTNLVTKKIKKIGGKFFRFDTDTFPEETKLQISFSDETSGLLWKKGSVIDIEEIRSVWYRRPAPSWTSRDIPSGYIKFIQIESKTALWSLYTVLDVFWMNPPLMTVSLLEHNKLYQTKTAASVGLRVPRTIITNDSSSFASFVDDCGGLVAVKVLRGKFFRKEDSNVPLFVFTTPISSADLPKYLADVALCPVFAQEYIPKKLELRVTIVADTIFACAIYSQDSERTRHDWRRYDLANVKHEAFQLPVEIQQKLLLLMRTWNLSYGAIDMIVTPSGEYVFLELNPNGQWAWIEGLTGLPISLTIAKSLCGKRD